MVYNIIKANSTIYGNNKFHGTIFQSIFGKQIYVSNKLFTWCLIISEAIILYLILQLHTLLPTILYITCKLLLLYRYLIQYHHFFISYKKRKKSYEKQGLYYPLTMIEAQKVLWDKYVRLGFFTLKGEIYTNSPSSTMHKINNAYFFRCCGIKTSFHQFTPRNNNLHLSFFNEQRIIGLTTKAKGNLLLPTKQELLYPVNKNFNLDYINKQFHYNISNNTGQFNDKEIG